MEGLSAGDLALLQNDGNGFGGNGCGMIFFLFILLLFRGNAFGGDERPATSADVQRGFDNNSVMNKLNGLENGLCDGFYATNNSIKDNMFNVTNAINNGTFATTNAITNGNYETVRAIEGCCCKTQNAILENRYAAERNTCELARTIENEGDKTRALIVENTIQNLRDKVAEKDRDILARDGQLSQLSQTATITSNILDSIGRYVTNPPCVPQCGYSYGCGC